MNEQQPAAECPDGHGPMACVSFSSINDGGKVTQRGEFRCRVCESVSYLERENAPNVIRGVRF